MDGHSITLSRSPVVEAFHRRSSETVDLIHPLSLVRRVLAKRGLSQTWFAAVLGINPQLVHEQLSDDGEKHLSLRRMARVDDAGFWKELFLLGLEDLGFKVVVMDEDQYEAHRQLLAASAKFTAEMTR